MGGKREEKHKDARKSGKKKLFIKGKKAVGSG